MMLVSLSLLGVVAARIGSQHQLVIGQKLSSGVAVSATGTAEVQADTMMKIDVGDTGRFKKVGSDQWLHCPDIIRSDGNEQAYCRFKSDPKMANVWKMKAGGSINNVPQYQFVDKSTKRCLMRQSCHSSTSAMSLGDPTRYFTSNQDCNHCGTKHWAYNAQLKRLAEHTGRNCVQSTGRIAHCDTTYQRLEFEPGEYKPPPPVKPIKKFECVTEAERIAMLEQKAKSESEKAIESFELQLFELNAEAESQYSKADKLRVATGILGVGSSIAGAIPVVGGAASFLTKCAGKATACAAEAAERAQAKAEHESVHVHLGKIGHDVQQGFRDMKLVLNRIKAEHRADTVAMQIASISQCFIDMHAKAQAIYELEWYPQDLVFAAKDLQQAYKQIGDTYAKARKVNQFLSSMRQCIRDKTGQLVEPKANLDVIVKYKNAMTSALQDLRDNYNFLRNTQGRCKQNRQSAENQRVLEALAARHQKELAQMSREATLRRVKSDERREEEQDTGGFPGSKTPEGVNCRRYDFVDECKNVKGGKTECENHCTNYHTLGIERKQRYRCRWQGKEGCRSSSGRLKYQKCLHGTCLTPEEKAE